MLHKFIGTTNVLSETETSLGHDSAELATGGGDTVSSGTISGWEDFARNDKGGDIGTKVLEEIGKTIEEHEGLLVGWSGSKSVESET